LRRSGLRIRGNLTLVAQRFQCVSIHKKAVD
jgi:hypothetical protein